MKRFERWLAAAEDWFANLAILVLVAISLSVCLEVITRYGFNRPLRWVVEFAEYGITVNCVGPGPLATNLIRSVPKQKIDRLLEQQAIPRMGTFEDVANTVDFFLQPESGFVTGQTIYLGGV